MNVDNLLEIKENGKISLYAEEIITNTYGEINFLKGFCNNAFINFLRTNNIKKIFSFDYDFRSYSFGINTTNVTFKTSKLKKSDLYQIVVFSEKYSESDKVIGVIKLNEFRTAYEKIKENRPDLNDFKNDLISNRLFRVPRFKNELFLLDKVQNIIFNTIKKTTTIPFLKEWCPYIIENSDSINNNYYNNASFHYVSDINNPDNIFLFSFTISEPLLIRAISQGLSSGAININGTNSVSKEFALNIKNLEDYLKNFSGKLIDKATESFAPRFNPAVDEFTTKEKDYFEYMSQVGSLKMFNAQQNVVGAISRSLKEMNSALLVGELGCGKTSLAIASTYINAKKKNPTNIVMCPGHLVEKWAREIERLYPGSHAVIVEDFNTILKYDKEIKNKNRRYPLFLVISKDTAKTNYVERPAVDFDAKNMRFICPDCGSDIIFCGKKISYSNIKIGDNVLVKANNVLQLLKAFTSKNEFNSFCNTITNYNCKNKRLKKNKNDSNSISTIQGHKYSFATCGSSLWTVTTKKESKWKKYPKIGFLHDDMIPIIKRSYALCNSKSDKSDIDNFVIKAYNSIIEVENNETKEISPRRYSIARYVRQRYKGLIDYLIADEVHLYSSSTSAQANAFGDFVHTAKKTIALTGTLLNGYANSIYHILFKMFSRSFMKSGFKYESESAFVDQFGVKKTSITYETIGFRERITRKSSISPGVSPELFTKFLLDKAIFISLSDISTGLPKYTETAIPIKMDELTKKGYTTATENLKRYFSDRENNDKKLSVAFQAAQKLSIYPDQPYLVSPIVNPDNFTETLVSFPDAIDSKNRKDFMSEKDAKILEITRNKIEKGENVLIYVNFVNKTDCVKRLEKIFKLADIKACTLTSSVSAKDRERWIDEKVRAGYRVLICNPTLVETGLDLLSFTNIIFYQVGYNLFTMRQASRRSLRLNQPNDVNVYFLYYENTAQEMVLSLMANKLQASMAIEGKFSEEGLSAMSNNDNILTRLANSLIDDIECKIEEGTFSSGLEAEKDDGSRFKMVYILNKSDKAFRKSFFSSNKKPKTYKLEKLVASVV